MQKVVAWILKDVGIGGVRELKKMGSLEAIRVVCKNHGTACVNLLYALESVIQGVGMEKLPEKDKRQLKRKYQAMLRKKEVQSPRG